MNEQIGGEGFESQQIEDDRSALQKEVLKENMGMEINKPDEHSLDPNKELDPEVEFGLKPKTDLLEAEIKEGSKDKILESQDSWAKVLDGIANSRNATKWIAQEESSPDAKIEKENYKQKFGDLIRLRSIGGSAVLRSLAFVLLNGKVSSVNKGTGEGDFIASRFKSERLAVLNRFWAAG
ncbi:hypothetical protein V6N13_142254 [Hibiscus sabdariffa]|uniref:Uncharacterized protein n=1 Tax=Hibiscus sabdariffa TaxID=183260 RepID=A0ABR2FDN3_9ROSI